MTRKQFRLALAATALAAVVLPVIGNGYRRQRLPRCDLDGAAIEPIYEVEIVDAHGRINRFCCIRCAEYWLARQPLSGHEVRVTDEVTGATIEAGIAYFVRSTVFTNYTTGNRVHTFRNRHDAEEHAAANGGRLLIGDRRPFASSTAND